MGQSKGGGYSKVPTATGGQKQVLDWLNSQVNPNLSAASKGYMSFLPGGEGGNAYANAAQERFKQQTIPSILGSFGENAKGSSALNQGLAAGAANLNSDIMSKMADYALQASHGLSSLGQGQAQIGSQPQFAYQQNQPSFLQQLLLGLTGAGGQIGGAYLGRKP